MTDFYPCLLRMRTSVLGYDCASGAPPRIAKESFASAVHTFPGEESKPREQGSLHQGGAIYPSKQPGAASSAVPAFRIAGSIPAGWGEPLIHADMLSEVPDSGRVFFTRTGRVGILGHWGGAPDWISEAHTRH